MFSLLSRQNVKHLRFIEFFDLSDAVRLAVRTYRKIRTPLAGVKARSLGGHGVDLTLVQRRRHLTDEHINLAENRAELFQGREAVPALELVALERDGDEYPAKLFVHSLKNLPVLEKDAVHRVPGTQLLSELSLVLSLVLGRLRRYGGHIEHAGRGDPITELLLAVFADGRQIDQHLKVESVQNIAEPELFFSGLVVDNADILDAVLLINVDSVDTAADADPAAVLQRYGIRGNLVSDRQFKVAGTEAALGKLFDDPQHKLRRRLANPVEQIQEALALGFPAAQMKVKIPIEQRADFFFDRAFF